MFGRRITFGKKQYSLAEVREMTRPTPDDDGVTRVFPKDIWNDPKIGSTLRELGFNPDDPRNIRKTADDYIAMFAAARKRLEQRAEAFNRDNTARYGYCRAVPFLVIDRAIWDGEHGAFFYASMDLIGFDDWNVLMLAADESTKQLCGIAGHPGTVPPITETVTNYVVEWKARHEALLESFGVTATGGQGGITGEQYEAEKDALRQEIIDKIGWMKPRIIAELLRIQG
jgi:hypothetical protein